MDVQKSNKKSKIIALFIILIVFFIVIATVFIQNNDGNVINIFTSKQTLNILSGSENEVLEPILDEFEKEHNIRINMTYEGSVDIMQELQNVTTDVSQWQNL